MMSSDSVIVSLSPSVSRNSNSELVCSLRTPLHNLVYPENHYFVGRDAFLQYISSSLLPQQGTGSRMKTTPAFAIWGCPGQGKTQIALRFAYQNKTAFESILLVNADRDQKLLEGLSEYAGSLGLIEKSTDLIRDAHKLLKWYQTTNTPWLLIYDNAEDPVLVNKFWPRTSKNGAIIITSRDHVFATSTVANRGRDVGPLSEAAAIDMLKVGISPLPCEDWQARRAVKFMGYLPLGVQALIGLINAAKCSLNMFNEQFDTPRKLLDEVKAKHIYRSFAPYEKTLAEVWMEELNLIQRENSNALRFVEIMSLLDPDKIQEELFIEGSEKAGISHEEIFKNRVKTFIDLTRLVGHNLPDSGTECRRFHVHRLLQVCTQRSMEKDTKRIIQAFSSATALVSAMMTSHWETSWPKIRHEYREYFPHVQAINQFYRNISSNNDALLDKIPITFLAMLRKAGSLCYKRNFFQLGFDVLETAEKIFETPALRAAILGLDKDILFESVEVSYSRACIATEIGDFQMSMVHFQKALDVWKDMKDKGHQKRDYHYLIGGLANSYSGLNENIKAEILFLECLEKQPPEESFSPYEVNLARCMWAGGKYAEASERLEAFIRRREERFGSDDTDDYLAGHAMYVLGNVRISQDRLDDSHSLHVRALRCWELTYGLEHHKTGDANHKVAWHLARIGKAKEALTYLDKSLVIYQSGSDQSFRKGEIARSTYKKALVLRGLGNFEQARKNLDAAEQLRKDVLGLSYFPSNGEVSYNSLVSLWAR